MYTHTQTFQRFDFTVNPVVTEEKTVTFTFPADVTDDNLEVFEDMLWDEFFKLPDTESKGHFSSWLFKSGLRIG